MGFMDKAKKMAEQAQSKLDEVQKQFNEGQPGGQPRQAPVEYDQHGRPTGPPPDTATPPHGDPVAHPSPPHGPPAPPPDTPMPDPGAPGAGDEDAYAPPKMTGGDPLAP